MSENYENLKTALSMMSNEKLSAIIEFAIDELNTRKEKDD